MTSPAREPDRSAPPPAPAARARPQPRQTTAARVLAFQQSVGNRATAGLVAAGARDLARAPTQVNEPANEKRTGTLGHYSGRARFEVEFKGMECLLTIRVRLRPDANVTKAETDKVKADTEAAFRRLWDEKFYFDDEKSKDRFFLRVRLKWVTSGPHVTVQLVKGKGHANEKKWFTDGIPESRAHELSHTLGLNDEYVDPTAVARQTPTSPGVFTDHSLMGHYYNEGPALAEVKLRHAQELAKFIGKATKRKLTPGYTGPYQGERLVRWRGIKATAKAAGDAGAEAAAAKEIAEIEKDMLIPMLTP